MDREDIQLFNPWGELVISKNRLPHWQQAGACYFATWRMADSIPQSKLDIHFEEKKIWLTNHPEPWDTKTEQEYHRRFSTQIDTWMDAGCGSCLLKKPILAKIVHDSLLYFEGTRTAMFSFVIMPNHVHALFAIHPEWKLDKVIQNWKGVTAREINRSENRQGGSFWQKDYFDRLIRDQRHYSNCVRYIRRNPEKANLKEGSYLLWESEIAREVE